MVKLTVAMDRCCEGFIFRNSMESTKSSGITFNNVYVTKYYANILQVLQALWTGICRDFRSSESQQFYQAMD